MSYKRLSDDKTEQNKTLGDLNLLGLWCATGNEWTSIIRRESLELTNQSLKEEKPRSPQGIVLLSVVITLTLIGAATVTQAPVNSWIPQENVKAASGK
jgi:hypothetical protein